MDYETKRLKGHYLGDKVDRCLRQVMLGSGQFRELYATHPTFIQRASTRLPRRRVKLLIFKNFFKKFFKGVL